MNSAMILVSGMCGTGKSTFATWLGEQLGAPVLRYDRLVRKLKELAPEEAAKGSGLAYGLFLFELEEHMGTVFIADYIFSTKQEAWLGELVEKTDCPTINVHFDCSPQTAYARYTRRNAQEPGVQIRPDVPFERFEEASRQNREFRFGSSLIPVDSEDFSKVSYEELLKAVQAALYPQNQP